MKTIALSAIAAVALAALAACSGSEKSDSEPAAEPVAETAAAPATEAVAADTGAAPDPAAAVDAAPAAATAVAFADFTGDAANGAKVFMQCKTCHVIDEGQNRVGPSLHAIIGRTAGQIPGYSYSAANKNSGIVWTEEALFNYLEDPRKAIPGTKMYFPGLKKPQDRADVIAYLKQATV